jgi:hypothetical protein
MSREGQTFIFGSACLAIVVCATSVILISRAATKSPLQSEQSTQSRRPSKQRNLALQPEAVAVNRRLGNRFKSGGTQSVLSGKLTLGGNENQATIVRRQTESGETVEVVLPDRRFSWSETEGTKASQGATPDAERVLVERLVFDSPDQFVLAQLRGASYQTIFRNARPTDAGENYEGPIWTVVRISEPQPSETLTPTSRWRLYYINADTGLIDRIECEVDGQKIEADILKWSEHDGEQLPSHIRWTANGQTLMEYQLNAFSQNE